jgi:hypothetical protein
MRRRGSHIFSRQSAYRRQLVQGVLLPNYFGPALRRWPVRVYVGIANIVNKYFLSFAQSLHWIAWRVPFCPQSLQPFQLFIHPHAIIRKSRDSVVGWLRDGWPRGREFSVLHVVQTGSEIHPTYPMGTGGALPVLKQQGLETDHSPPASAEVKKIWIYTSTPPYAFMV